MTPFWQSRELRPGAPSITAPDALRPRPRRLQRQAADDRRLVRAAARGTAAGRRCSASGRTTTRGGNTVVPEWARTDFYDVAVAWFDRYLKGLPTGVETWPRVQIQDTTGQWRAQPDWPMTGGPGRAARARRRRGLGSQSPGGDDDLRRGPRRGRHRPRLARRLRHRAAARRRCTSPASRCSTSTSASTSPTPTSRRSSSGSRGRRRRRRPASRFGYRSLRHLGAARGEPLRADRRQRRRRPARRSASRCGSCRWTCACRPASGCA